MPLDLQKLVAFENAIGAMAEFKRVFGRDLKPDFIAELYAAKELQLELVEGPNAFGWDATDKSGLRYQVKQRNAQNVDVNNFEFDFLILVNLDEAYRLVGLWKMTRDQAKSIFVWRERHRKYQTTQDKVKRFADRIV